MYVRSLRTLFAFFLISLVAITHTPAARVLATGYNGANLRDLKFKSFTYFPKTDTQEVTLTWKADRNNSFEIYVKGSNGRVPYLFKAHRGTSIKLVVPPDGSIHGAIRAEKHPKFVIPFAFESPLRFENLFFSDLRNSLKDFKTNAADRAELWQVMKNRKVLGKLGLFLLVAPPILNAVPGASLSEAVASNIVATVSDVANPLEVSTFLNGLSSVASARERGYFHSRIIELNGG